MKKLDVRVKLLILSSLSLLGVLYQKPLPLFILLITAILLLIAMRIPFFLLCKKLKPLLKLVLIMTLLQSVFTPSAQPIFTLFHIHLLSVEGLYNASIFLLRMLVIISSASILSTNNSREIMQGLIQLHIPYEICLMSTMGIKFIPILREQFHDTFIAMQLRGINMKEQSLKDKITLIAQMLVPVVASSIQTARSVSVSLQLRGFGAYKNRTSYYTLSLTTIDYTVIVLTLLYVLLFILLKGGILSCITL